MCVFHLVSLIIILGFPSFISSSYINQHMASVLQKFHVSVKELCQQAWEQMVTSVIRGFYVIYHAHILYMGCSVSKNPFLHLVHLCVFSCYRKSSPFLFCRASAQPEPLPESCRAVKCVPLCASRKAASVGLPHVSFIWLGDPTANRIWFNCPPWVPSF